MARRGRYYIGRVIKMGVLTGKMIVEACRNSPVVIVGQHAWTITNFVELFDHARNQAYYYGRLTKFSPEGSVNVLDESRRLEVTQTEPDLVIARSPFIYLPDYSGIAYLHQWNQIENRTFVRRFCHIIEEKHEKMFVQCHIDPITDLRTFEKKVSDLDSIDHISASISPPNPLFSPLWRPLKEYLEKRNTGEMQINERANEGGHLTSDLPKHISEIQRNESDKAYTPEIDIGDAAILMAADGYGRGRIEGTSNRKKVVVLTSESQKSFVADKDPMPETLYEAAEQQLRSISDERYMEHPDE